MQAFLMATGIVTLAEMGDKTQLLALVLAARFKKPWPIVAGILTATLLNHALAGAAGAWVQQWLTAHWGPNALQWLLGLSFFAMALWMLIPDKLDDVQASSAKHGVFLTTTGLFFLAEMGDKTQIATVMLAAQYSTQAVWVIVGTTLGMMIANAPVVWLGERLTQKIPTQWIHRLSAAIFLVMGVAALVWQR